MRARPVALAIAVCAASTPVRAGAEDEASARPAEVAHARHWGVGAGGFSAITGPADFGLALGAELYPGGRFGRFGIRSELRGYQDGDDGRASLGVTFLAAASRPRLQLALHGDLGVTQAAHLPTVGGGIQTQLWIKWPFAIAFDGCAVLIVDGTDTVLELSSSAQLRVAY